jgi:DNA-binding transcriptional regulator YhcF (GntR family)
MEFRNDKAIYLQIADYVYNKVLSKEWKPGDRIPSVREIGALLEVNPNTALRTYTELQDSEIIVNKRGIGFYLTENCFTKVFNIRKKEFTNHVLPDVFTRMLSLNITMEELKELYNQFIEKLKK